MIFFHLLKSAKIWFACMVHFLLDRIINVH